MLLYCCAVYEVLPLLAFALVSGGGEIMLHGVTAPGQNNFTLPKMLNSMNSDTFLVLFWRLQESVHDDHEYG